MKNESFFWKPYFCSNQTILKNFMKNLIKKLNKKFGWFGISVSKNLTFENPFNFPVVINKENFVNFFFLTDFPLEPLLYAASKIKIFFPSINLIKIRSLHLLPRFYFSILWWREQMGRYNFNWIVRVCIHFCSFVLFTIWNAVWLLHVNNISWTC